MIHRLSGIFALFFVLTFALHGQDEMIVIDKQARHANPTLRFDGVSGDANAAALVKNNIFLCGWFDVVRSGNADYVISGETLGNTVRLNVSNSAGKMITSVTGSDPRNAVDRMLHALFQIPGICQSKLVFTVMTSGGNKELAMCNFDGTEIKQITRHRMISMDPVWAPNGRSVVYSLIGKGFAHLIQYDIYTKLFRRVSRYDGINAGGALSPDGKYIALILNLDNQVDLYVRELEGKTLHRLTRNKAVEASPCWSPDGSMICFVSDVSGRPVLYTVSPTGGTPKRLAGLAGSERVAPEWSRENKLTYSARVGRNYVVAVADMSSGTPVMENMGEGVQAAAGEGPTWAPDGRHVAVEENGMVYIVDTWLGKKRALFRGKTKIGQPGWSPILK